MDHLEEDERRRLLDGYDRIEKEHLARKQGIADQGLGKEKGPGSFGEQITGGLEDAAASMQNIQGDWENAVTGLQQTWADGLARMMEGTLSWKEAVRGLWESLRDTVVNLIAQMVTKYVVGKLLELVVHKSTAAAETAAEQQRSAQLMQIKFRDYLISIGIDKATAASAASSAFAKVGSNAAVSASNTVASESKSNWIYALIAGAAVLAAVLAMRGNIKSAAGGMDIGPGENPLTQLHEKEMVLPAPLAERVRAMSTPPIAQARSIVTALVPAVPAMAAIAGTLVSFKRGIASAAGGWDIGPHVAAPALAVLHQREMVLPATMADRIRNLSSPARETEDDRDRPVVHIHQGNVHAWDSEDAGRVYKRTMGELVDALEDAYRNGRFRGRRG